MSDEPNGTPVTLHTCSVSGEQGAGKHYILKTTEGEDLVCPEALFHNAADRQMVTMITQLRARVALLEKKVNGDQDEPEPARKPEPAKKATARRPAKKAGS